MKFKKYFIMKLIIKKGLDILGGLPPYPVWEYKVTTYFRLWLKKIDIIFPHFVS